MATTPEATSNGTGSYASINGLELYYEVHGTGTPLVLLPGGMMTIQMLSPLVSLLATTRQVIAVEPQAHGHTADINRPFTYQHLADDTAALIEQRGLGAADVVGFSLGASVALQTAIRHPDRVRKLVCISGTYRSASAYPEIRAMQQTFEPDLPMLASLRDAYVQAAGTAAGWPALVGKMRQLGTEEYDWSQEIAGLQTPTLIMVGDADLMPVSEAVALFELLGGDTAASAMGQFANTQLAVLPATTHFSILSRTELLGAIITPYLDAPLPPSS